MTANTMLQEAIDAVHQGQKLRARDLLTRLLRTDKHNPDYWLWMSAVVDSPKERAYCLKSLLRLDPENMAAIRGLALLGELPPGIEIPAAPLVRRSWQVAQENPSETGLKGLMRNPLARLAGLAVLTALVVYLILAGISGSNARRNSLAAARATSTSGPPPTFTPTPTSLPNTRLASRPPTATPTFDGPTPLWFILPATYTPTPVYVATPHSVSEAYQIAMRAYDQGKWELALSYMRQASQAEPQAADLQYHIGELHRFLGEYDAAMAAYQAALRLDPNFGPAYLGRARASLARSPRKADIGLDLQRAVEADPFFADAWLDRAAYWIQQEDYDAALQDLQAAEKLAPESPLVPLLHAQLALHQGDQEAAVQQANLALQRDQTSLPAILVLGHASLLNGEFQQAIQSLKTYLTFFPDDLSAMVMLGRAYFEAGQDYQAAIEVLDQVLALPDALIRDEELTEVYFMRGLSYLALDQGQNAINDLLVARRETPASFEVNLGLGRGLVLTNRLKEARDMFNLSLKLAETDQEHAAVYYWRAQVHALLGSDPAASADWQALLALPTGAVPSDWAKLARSNLPTATPVPPTATRTATATSTRTPTKTPAPTSTRAAARTPTPASTASRTPSSTVRASTPTATRTPVPSRPPVRSLAAPSPSPTR